MQDPVKPTQSLPAAGADSLSSSLGDARAMRDPDVDQAVDRYLGIDPVPALAHSLSRLASGDALNSELTSLRSEIDRLREELTTTTGSNLASRLEELAALATRVDAHSKELTAAVILPPEEALRVHLVTSNSLERLEEYRADVSRYYGLAGIFGGAVLGIIINWVTTPELTITRTSVILMVILAALTWACVYQISHLNQRAARIQAQMLHQPPGPSPGQPPARE